MLLIDHFVEILHQVGSRKYHKQAVLAINEIILGTAGIGIEMEIEIAGQLRELNPSTLFQSRRLTMSEVDSILRCYLDPALWNRDTTNFDFFNQGQMISIEELNDNILMSVLLLEGVGNLAEVLGKNFDDLLMDSLYDILEKLGDSNHLVTQSAWATVQRIMAACEYPSVVGKFFFTCETELNRTGFEKCRLLDR